MAALAGAVVLAILATGTAGPAIARQPSGGGAPQSVIVRAEAGSTRKAEAAVRRVGGTVGRSIAIIDGFVAEVPEGALPGLQRAIGVLSVTPDSSLHLLADSYSPETDTGSLFDINKIVGADKAFRTGVTGKGVDVALIDSGVVPVQGLSGAGKVVNGPDLSFDSQAANLRYLDAYGHGTHMAGIIAGRDGDATRYLTDPSSFTGVAPDARLVNVKVAASDGSTDVSQVLAAIDWVVQHRNDNGMNVRVLNLSFGTDSTQDYRIDPLSYAVEVAWRRGIVVVAAAGNRGTAPQPLDDPAVDPFVIAAGASDPAGTVNTRDDAVAAFSSRGDAFRRPDLLAPGKSVVSLRNAGSTIDLTHPEGRVGERFFRGSGTSQAAAVTSGAAALLLQQRPTLTPDQVKRLLTGSARKLADPSAWGAGQIDVDRALADATPSAAPQVWEPSAGTGSLEAARGSVHVSDRGGELRGEQDIFGKAWDGSSWAGSSWSGSSWSGGMWNGSSWSGSSWSGSSWSGSSWSGSSWTGSSWSGSSWSGSSWSGSSWSGSSWSGSSWSGSSWSGSSWSGSSWSNAIWGV